MNYKDLARSVAVDLGPDVRSALDSASPGNAARSLGLPEALAIGGFLLQCAQLALQLWQAKSDRTEVIVALANSPDLTKTFPNLDVDSRMECIARVINKLDIETGAVPELTRSFLEDEEKLRWVIEHAKKRQSEGGLATRSGTDANARSFIGGATILLPFADQDWWIVYQNIGWVPDVGEENVVRVDVPRGFVTDLASIPRFLWAVLNKVGLYGNAAIFHDWLYWQQTCSREVADQVFDRAMYDMGVDAATRRSIWSAVRVFGVFSWKSNAKAKSAGEKRLLKQFPDSPTVKWADWRCQADVFA